MSDDLLLAASSNIHIEVKVMKIGTGRKNLAVGYFTVRAPIAV